MDNPAVINVYSTGCPQCRVLIKKLDESGLPYTLITNEKEVLEEAQKRSITFAPFVIFKDTLYDFTNALKLVKECKGE